MFPEDPKDPELGEEAEELLTHWPLGDKSPAEWEDFAARIDARIKITEVGSTPDYLLEAPLFEEQDVQRRSHPRMKRPSEGSLAALAKASLAKDASPRAVRMEAEREALARSLLSLAVKARAEARSTTAPHHVSPSDESSAEDGGAVRDGNAVLSGLVNGPQMQVLPARPLAPRVSGQPPAAPIVSSVATEVPPAPVAGAATKTGSRERGSMWVGIAFGLLGMAAAGVMYVASAERPRAPIAPAPMLAEHEAPAARPAPITAPAPRAEGATRAGDVLNVEEVPLAEPASTPVAAHAKAAVHPDRATSVRPGGRTPATTPASPPPHEEKPAATTPAAGPSEPGMVMADSRGTLPDHPSTGAVQAAVGTVMGAARACVAGQNAASRATLNFSSDGRVQSVAVTGPAQGTHAEPCLRNALSGARVQPFARPAYSVNLTVRPQ